MTEAGSQYLAMTKANNVIADRIHKLSETDSIATWQSEMTNYAKACDTLARALIGGHWPIEAQAAAQRLATDALSERAVLQEASSTTSVLALSSAISAQTSVFTAAKADAAAFRIILGLPSN